MPQIAKCPQIHGWLTFTELFLVIDYLTIALGLYCTFLSLNVRRARAARRNEPIPPYTKILSFESFLLLFTAATISNAVGVTLSATVGTKTMILHALQSGTAFLASCAVIVYVEMVLRSSATTSKSIRVLHHFLPALFIPVSLTCGLFVYQGVLSDFVQYTDSSDTAKSAFSGVVLVTSMSWLFTFLCMFAFVVISRHSFSSYIRTIEGDSRKSFHFAGLSRPRSNPRGISASVGTGSSATAISIGMKSFSGDKAQQQQQHRGVNSQHGATTNAGAFGGDRQGDVIRVLRNSVTTLGWLAMGCGILIAYSAFYGVVVLILGSPNFIYFLTLVVNYMTPSLIALFVFIVNIVNLRTQGRAAGELSSSGVTGSVDTVEV
ncbi:hypothetical protein HK101_006943 [Irineochytrium annulatum]|nr:hypothetical protein HK101_006943 [Irineochytrium annulatum]